MQYHRYKAKDRQGWLDLRNGKVEGHEELGRKVGGSQIGAISGHSKYSSFLRELEYEVGYSPRPSLEGNIRVELGRINEQTVADFFEKVSGKKLHVVNAILTNDETAPNCKASIDRKIANEDSGAEMKTSFGMMMDQFEDGDFPMSYWDQCLLYLLVTGLARWYLAILTGDALHVYLMTTVKAEADRYAELKKKFLFAPDGECQGEDWDEWCKKWRWVEAVYHVDANELKGVQIRAKRFCDCRDKVLAYMKGKSFATEKDRLAYLQNAIIQVVDPEDLNGDSDKEAIDALVSDDADNKTIKIRESTPTGQELASLVEEKERLNAEVKALKAQIDGINAKIRLKAVALKSDTIVIERTDADAKPVKVTLKTDSPTRNVSADAVELYFKTHGIPVPERLITVSEKSPTLRAKLVVKKPSSVRKVG